MRNDMIYFVSLDPFYVPNAASILYQRYPVRRQGELSNKRHCASGNHPIPLTMANNKDTMIHRRVSIIRVTNSH